MAKSTASSSQEHLPIAGIQDGIVIMTDGSVRTVLRIEPINFDLKSEQEQNAIIYAYQGFLNSLDFPIQFVIQSKKLDLERYLLRLKESQKQTEDYIGFLRQLITVANIMSKRFYVVISYSGLTKESAIAQFGSILHKQPTGPVMDQDQFNRYKSEGINRASIIAGGLGRLGVKCELLGTQQLIELFYGIYNPDVAAEERLSADVADMNSGVVSSPGSLEQLPNQSETDVAGIDLGITTSTLPTSPQAGLSPIDEIISDQGQAVPTQPTQQEQS
jgi:hypothetical protein